MRRIVPVAAIAATVSCGGEARLDVHELVAEYDRLGAQAQWPSFEPSRVPLAVYDGERTWLLRHPDPPTAFHRDEGGAGVWVMGGRHEAATANTAADLGGFRTAVVLADSGPRRLPELARTLLHEAFHVHQALRHPEWSPNEVELFTYPVEDVEALRSRRLETTTLRRALRSEPPDSVRRACWTRAWLRFRTGRMRRLPEGAAAYERGAELSEGLARYVEAIAAGEPGAPPIPAEGYPPEAVRSRAYDVGHALAWLLDRTRPGWKEALEDGATSSLEAALAAALDASPGRACRLTPDESARALVVARADIRDLARRRAESRARFEEARGWRVEVVAPEGAPLFPEAFDPQNIDRLGEGAVLHGRWLRLQGAGGSLEVLGRGVLTEAAGPHPLFTGVRRVLVTGIPSEPEAEEEAGALRLRAEGFTAELPGATLTRSGRSWRVELAAGG